MIVIQIINTIFIIAILFETIDYFHNVKRTKIAGGNLLMKEYNTNDVVYDELSTRQCVYYITTEKGSAIYHGKISIFNPKVCKMRLIDSFDKNIEGAK